MSWSNYNSGNENGLLRFNGPYRGRTAEGTGVGSPQVVEIIKSIKVGQVKVYGRAVTDGKVEKDNRQNEAK